jgi:hypothetical protein
MARKWELILRKEIHWGAELRDDSVILPEFRVPWIHDELDWGATIEQIGGDHGGAFTWDPPIKSVENIDLLRTPTITVDGDQTRRLLELTKDTFDELLDVRLATRWTPLFPMTRTWRSSEASNKPCST